MAEEKKNGKQNRGEMPFIFKPGKDLTPELSMVKRLVLAICYMVTDPQIGWEKVAQELLGVLQRLSPERFAGQARADANALAETDLAVRAVLDTAYGAGMYFWKNRLFQGEFPFAYTVKDGKFVLDSTTKAALKTLKYIGSADDQRTRRTFFLAGETLMRMRALSRKQIEAVKALVIKNHPLHAQDLEAPESRVRVMQET